MPTSTMHLVRFVLALITPPIFVSKYTSAIATIFKPFAAQQQENLRFQEILNQTVFLQQQNREWDISKEMNCRISNYCSILSGRTHRNDVRPPISCNLAQSFCHPTIRLGT